MEQLFVRIDAGCLAKMHLDASGNLEVPLSPGSPNFRAPLVSIRINVSSGEVRILILYLEVIRGRGVVFSCALKRWPL